MSQHPPLPSGTPLKARKASSWLLKISYGLNVLLVIGLFILLPKIVDYPPPDETPGPRVLASESPTATIAPSPAPLPVVRFLVEQTTFTFSDPIHIPVEYENLDWAQADVTLLKADGEPLPGDIELEKQEQEIVLPPKRLVGCFTLRISLAGEELGTFAFEVQPPKLSLKDTLDVQPRLDIAKKLEGLNSNVAKSLGDKYLLLPEYSTLALKDEYRDKGWELRVDLPGDEWEATEGKKIKFTDTYDRTRDALPVEIVLTGVYDQNGNVYTYKGALPLIAQQPMQDIGNNLFVYNAPVDEFLDKDDNPVNVMLDNVSKFKDVFGLNGAEITSGDKTYRFVMLIGIKGDAADGDSRWEKFPKYDNIESKAILPMDQQEGSYGNLKRSCSDKDFFIVDSMDDGHRKIVALFGFVEMPLAEEAGQ